MSICLAALMLVSLFAAVSSAASVSAAQGGSTNVQTPVVGGTAPVVGAPAVCTQNGTSVDLFVRGANYAIYWKHSDDGITWPSTSVSLGGNATSDPGAMSAGNGIIAVFVRGTTGALYEKITTNAGASWSAWTNLGGQLATNTGPAACSWPVSGTGPVRYHIGVAVVGMRGEVYWETLGVTSWINLGGVSTSSPAVSPVLNSPGYIEVMVRGSSGALWEKQTGNYGASWSGWSNWGGQLASGTGPAGDGYGDAYAIGTNHALYCDELPMPGWTNLFGTCTSSPATVSAPSVTSIFVRGADGYLFEKTYNGAVYSAWTLVGGI